MGIRIWALNGPLKNASMDYSWKPTRPIVFFFDQPRKQSKHFCNFICSTTSNQRVGFCVSLRLNVGIEPKVEGFELMALTNFILTVAGVSAVVVLLRSDVKQSASIFRRNVKHIRQWLEEESASASK